MYGNLGQRPFVITMQIKPDTIIGKVRVDALIGEGVSSEVYRCYYTDNGRPVALKLIKPKVLLDPHLRERVRREIEVLVKFQFGHPNIIRLFEKIEHPEYSGYLMEYLENGSLEQLLTRSHTLEIAHVLTVLSDVTNGLTQLHKNGVIHRDLKPANLLFDKGMRAKITDFGTSYRNSAAPLTRKGDLVGTIAYSAPEYMREGKFDERSDLFAVGVIAYELITGQNPYGETNLLKHIQFKTESSPPAPHIVKPTCPLNLSNFVMKALEIDPANRFQASKEMFQALQRDSIVM